MDPVDATPNRVPSAETIRIFREHIQKMQDKSNKPWIAPLLKRPATEPVIERRRLNPRPLLRSQAWYGPNGAGRVWESITTPICGLRNIGRPFRPAFRVTGCDPSSALKAPRPSPAVNNRGIAPATAAENWQINQGNAKPFNNMTSAMPGTMTNPGLNFREDILFMQPSAPGPAIGGPESFQRQPLSEPALPAAASAQSGPTLDTVDPFATSRLPESDPTPLHPSTVEPAPPTANVDDEAGVAHHPDTARQAHLGDELYEDIEFPGPSRSPPPAASASGSAEKGKRKNTYSIYDELTRPEDYVKFATMASKVPLPKTPPGSPSLDLSDPAPTDEQVVSTRTPFTQDRADAFHGDQAAFVTAPSMIPLPQTLADSTTHPTNPPSTNTQMPDPFQTSLQSGKRRRTDDCEFSGLVAAGIALPDSPPSTSASLGNPLGANTQSFSGLEFPNTGGDAVYRPRQPAMLRKRAGNVPKERTHILKPQAIETQPDEDDDRPRILDNPLLPGGVSTVANRVQARAMMTEWINEMVQRAEQLPLELITTDPSHDAVRIFCRDVYKRFRWMYFYVIWTSDANEDERRQWRKGQLGEEHLEQVGIRTGPYMNILLHKLVEGAKTHPFGHVGDANRALGEFDDLFPARLVFD